MTTPYSLQAEKDALYKMIVHGSFLLANALAPEDFFEKAHKTIFTLEKDLMLKYGNGDYLSIREAVKDKKEVPLGYIEDLCSIPILESSESAIIRILKHKRIEREIKGATDKVALSPPAALPSALMELSEEMRCMLPADSGATKEEIMAAMDKKEEKIPTGFPQTDILFDGGLPPGSLMLISARPSVGKSALATNLASNILKNNKIPCFFSLEMSQTQIMTRIIAAQNNINTRDVKSSMVNDLPLMPELHIGTNDIQDIQMTAMGTSADCIIIDYLGLITSQSKENRFQQMDEISRTIKLLAVHTGKPIILLTQLNREIEKAKTPRAPNLSDLWGGGEKDADIITALWEPKDPTEEDPFDNVKGVARSTQSKPIRKLEWTVLKNRNGPTGFTDLIFDAPKMLMRDYLGNDVKQSDLPF